MSLWSKIRGTIETVFQLGIGGPQLKANAGVIEARDASDAAFVIVRGLTPVGNTDLATKLYVDGALTANAVREIRYALGTGASQSSTATIPANANVECVRVSITTPYSGGATISVGQTGTPALLAATTDINPQTAGIYEVNQDTGWGGSALAVLTTVGGAPGAGVGVCIVKYSLPSV